METIGLSQIFDKKQYLVAAKDAIENYLADGNNNAYNVIIIIKVYGDLELTKVNEVFNLVQENLYSQEISFNIREIKDEILRNKMEIILVGVN